MAKLFTLECILNKLVIDTNKGEQPEILAKGKCGDILSFNIRYYHKRSAFDVFSAHSGHGTAVLFSCLPNALISSFTKNFTITLEDKATSKNLGTVKVTFDNKFEETVRNFSEENNTYKFEKSLPIFTSTGAEGGKLEMKSCLVYHGFKIEVPMNNFPSQMLIPMPKRTKTEQTNQWKPVFVGRTKPARSEMDPQMEIYAEMAGVPHVPINNLLTPEYINENLCGHKSCPGAKKFKEYGLGPLATGGGLGTISTIQNLKPNGIYGISQAYGTLDNYGAYGLFVKKPEKKTRRFCCGSPDCPYATLYGLQDTDPGIVELGEEAKPVPTPAKVCQCKKCGKCCRHGSKQSSKSSTQNSNCGGPLCPQKYQKFAPESIGKPCPYRQAAGSDCQKNDCPNLKKSKGQGVQPRELPPLDTTREQGLTTEDCRQYECPHLSSKSPSTMPTLPLPSRYQVPSTDDCQINDCPYLASNSSKPPPTMPSLPIPNRYQIPTSDDCQLNDCPFLASIASRSTPTPPPTMPSLPVPNRYQVPVDEDFRKKDCSNLSKSPPKSIPQPQSTTPSAQLPTKHQLSPNDICRKNDCPNLKNKPPAEPLESGIDKKDCPHIRLPETMPTLPVPTRFEGPFLGSDDDTSVQKRDNICEGLECPYHVGSGHPGTCPIGTCPLTSCGNKRKLSPRKETGEEEETDSAKMRKTDDKDGTKKEDGDKKGKSPDGKKKGKYCPSTLCWTYKEPEPEDGVCGGKVCPLDKKKKDDEVASGDAYSGPTEKLGGDIKTKRISLLTNEEGKKLLLKESLSKLNNRQRDILGSLQLSEKSDGYFMISRLLASRQRSQKSMNNYLKADEKEVKRGPCTRKSCKSFKYKTCSECGGMSRSGGTCDQTNISFSTVSYESIESMLAASKKTDAQLKAEQLKKEKQAALPPKQTVKIKKKKYCRFVYGAGENYPGLRIGHRTCVLGSKNVPAQMGWLWNIKRDWEKRRIKNWKPGYLNKTIEDRIVQYRRARGIPDPPELKMLVKKKFTLAPVESEEEEEPVLPKPTLTIEKKEGNYLITMNPLKDPKTLVDREDPYMRCKPIQFLITKQQKPAKPQVVTVYDEIEGEFEGEGNFDYNSCLCDENFDASSSSSSDSELNIEFTTPAGLIIPERMKRPPNVVMVNTQFKEADFSCADCPVVIPMKFQKVRRRKKKQK